MITRGRFIFLFIILIFPTFAQNCHVQNTNKTGFYFICKNNKKFITWSGKWNIPFKMIKHYDHDFYDEVIYITSGSVTLIVQNKTILLKKGDVYYIPHDKTHRFSKWVINNHLSAYYYMKKHGKIPLPKFYNLLLKKKKRLYIAYYEMPKSVIKTQKTALLVLMHHGYPFYFDPKSKRIATGSLRIANKFFISGFFIYTY